MPFYILFLLIPVIEIALFINVGALIGTWTTIGVILTSALIGVTLVRLQGLKQLKALRVSMIEGQNIGQSLGHGFMILGAGALLITPGFFTDSVGFVLLIPKMRTFLWRILVKHYGEKMKMASAGARPSPNASHRHEREDTINVDFEDITEK